MISTTLVQTSRRFESYKLSKWLDIQVVKKDVLRRYFFAYAFKKPRTIILTIESFLQMTSALHHLQVYRIRSKILWAPSSNLYGYVYILIKSIRTHFTGPHARVPSLTDVVQLLSELNEWKRQAPQQDSRSFPQQGADRVQGTYLQAVLLLIRPILMSNAVDPDLMQLCVNFAADACEVSNWPKELTFSKLKEE